MSCLALTGCLASAGLRDLMVNPKNLIRFVPAEGLDVTRAYSCFSTKRRREQCANHLFYLLPLWQPFPFLVSPPSSADRSLTIYTYDSFVAEWGPGPKIEAAFEAECGCDLKWVGIADGVALLNRLRLEGENAEAGSFSGSTPIWSPKPRPPACLKPTVSIPAAVSVPGDFSDDVPSFPMITAISP
jgi:ABC-type thiamine transport system substrate-binding protein